MPAPVIITVVAVPIIYMLWVGFALGRPAIRDPGDRRAFEVDAEQVEP